MHSGGGPRLDRKQALFPGQTGEFACRFACQIGIAYGDTWPRPWRRPRPVATSAIWANRWLVDVAPLGGSKPMGTDQHVSEMTGLYILWDSLGWTVSPEYGIW